MSNSFDEIQDKIDEFLQLELGMVVKGEKIGKEISRKADEFRSLWLKKEIKSTYVEILSRIKNQSSKLSRDVLNSEKSSLKSDWKKIAKRDQSKLRDEILAFQEFLNIHEETIRKRLSEEKHGIDIRDLARRLKDEDSVDEITCSRFCDRIKTMNSEEIELKTGEFRDRLTRISKWLLILKEIRNIDK